MLLESPLKEAARSGGPVAASVWVSLLEAQRRLYDLDEPRARFQEYLRILTDDRGDLALPLSRFNPMGKEHVPARLDELLGRSFEELGREAHAQAAARLGAALDGFGFGFVLADDLGGGWTQRHQMEFEHLFAPRGELARGWGAVLLWTAEPVESDVTRLEVLRACYRTAHLVRHGFPRTLEERMVQEGRALRFASPHGAPPDLPELAPDEREAVAAALAPHRGSEHVPTVFNCLFGDSAARAVGYRPLGADAGPLPPRAGFSLAYWAAVRSDAPPEAWVVEP